MVLNRWTILHHATTKKSACRSCHCVPVFEKIVKDRISAVDRRSSSLRANSSQYVLSQDLKLDMTSFRKSRARKIDSKGKICRLDGGSRPSSVQPECDMRPQNRALAPSLPN